MDIAAVISAYLEAVAVPFLFMVASYYLAVYTCREVGLWKDPPLIFCILKKIHVVS